MNLDGFSIAELMSAWYVNTPEFEAKLGSEAQKWHDAKGRRCGLEAWEDMGEDYRAAVRDAVRAGKL